MFTFNESIYLRELSKEEFRELTHDANESSIVASLKQYQANELKEFEQRIQALIEEYVSPARWFGLYDDKTYIGYISFCEYECPTPEIQIEIHENYQNRGIGYAALSFLMAEIFRQRADIEYFLYRVRVDNGASIKLVEKLGGQWIKKGDFVEKIIRKYHISRDSFTFNLK